MNIKVLKNKYICIFLINVKKHVVRIHNHEVTGSIPVLATQKIPKPGLSGFFIWPSAQIKLPQARNHASNSRSRFIGSILVTLI